LYLLLISNFEPFLTDIFGTLPLPTMNEREYIDIVKSLIGEEIYSISNSQYFFNDEMDDEDIGDIEIVTDSGLKVCFKLLSDGESVGAYKGDLNIPSSFI
jgi:hypothetical protein